MTPSVHPEPEGPLDDGYASTEAVAHYRERARSRGLFDAEAYIFDRYFDEEGASVLDVGCGAGRTTKPLAERGLDVVGVDLSEPMIEAARAAYPDVAFRVDDATDLSYPDAAFDYALFSSNGLDCIHPQSERVQALREIHRVLRPGGVFALSVHNWLYAVPALVTDVEYVRRYYLANGNLRRLSSPYKRDPEEYGLFLHFGDPWRARSRLEGCGFELLERVTKRRSPLRYFERSHHYVLRKE